VSRVDKKVQTRDRITKAIGRSFRKNGFSGVGVDSLAKGAGVTSGAFYVHFDSKSAAFREAVRIGMNELREGVLYFQHTFKETWWFEFVNFYLGFKRTCDASESCVLQSLSPDVARSDDSSRAIFEEGLRNVAEAVLIGPPCKGKPYNLEATLVALATLVGTVTLCRAVSNHELSELIAASAMHMLIEL
jgi:AcrR family transcriptional regulator